jgi:hypothetical protein
MPLVAPSDPTCNAANMIVRLVIALAQILARHMGESSLQVPGIRARRGSTLTMQSPPHVSATSAREAACAANVPVPPRDFEPDNDPHATLDRRQLGPDEIMRHHDPVSLWFGASPTYYDIVQREWRLLLSRRPAWP